MPDNAPLPKRNETSPPRHMGAVGRSVPHNGIVTFPVQAKVEHDRVRDPDALPSARIVLPDPVTDVEFDAEPRPWGNGILSSFQAKLPTPPDAYEHDLAVSVIAHRLERIEVELRAFVAAVRGLADTLKTDDPNEAA